MSNPNRRTYLKTAAVGAGALGLAGIAEVASKLQASSDAGTSQTAQSHQPQSQQRDRGRSCPAGTEHLATYETTDDGQFEQTEGEDVVTFSNIQLNDDGEVVDFDWESSEPVAVAMVKHGPNSTKIVGGLTGSADLSDRQHAVGRVSFCGPRRGRAIIWGRDSSGEDQVRFDAEMHRTEDPTESNRQGVLHVTSNEKETTNYVPAMVDVFSDVRPLTFNELNGLSFNYVENGDIEHPLPNEVFVAFVTPDGDDTLHLAFVHLDSGNTSDGETVWQTMNLLETVRNQTWRVMELSIEELLYGNATEHAVTQFNVAESHDGLLSAFGDATLLGVGLGVGNPETPTTLHRYYDDFTVEGGGESASFDFPASVPMEVTFDPETIESDRGGKLTATLTFVQDEAGLSLNDVATETVKLTGLRPVAPPLEAGVAPTNVKVQGDEFVAQFQRKQVAEFLDSGDHRPIISGDFADAWGTAFFGIGELTVD